MKRFVVAMAMVVMPLLAGCGVGEVVEGDEQAVKVCTLLQIYCPPECKQTGGGCPLQCHCPKYNACGPSLKCGTGEVCCTGAGPVNIDPALNQYSCNPAGTLCPL